MVGTFANFQSRCSHRGPRSCFNSIHNISSRCFRWSSRYIVKWISLVGIFANFQSRCSHRGPRSCFKSIHNMKSSSAKRNQIKTLRCPIKQTEFRKITLLRFFQSRQKYLSFSPMKIITIYIRTSQKLPELDLWCIRNLNE